MSLLLVSSVISRPDSIPDKNRIVKLTGAWAGSNARVHRFSDLSHFSSGVFIAMEFNQDYLFGWEGYNVNAFNTQSKDISIRSSSLLFGYTYSKLRFIRPVVLLNVGESWSQTTTHELVHSLALHGALGIEFQIFPWLRLGGDLGYRYFSPMGMDWIRDDGFSGPYGGLKVKFGWSWIK